MRRQFTILLLALAIIAPHLMAQNFLDHFPGSSLDSRWTSVTGGSGTVTVSDSEVTFNSPVNADAAFIYFNTKLDKTKSQLWLFAFERTTGGAGFMLIEKTTAPVVEDFSTFSPRRRANFNYSTISNLGISFERWNSSDVRQHWNEATQAWEAVTKHSIDRVSDDNYFILGFEIDGPNSQWRLLGGNRTSPGGYTYDQGWRLFSISDWTTWANTKPPNDDLWILFGDPASNVTSGTSKLEWVRFADTPPGGFEVDEGRIHAWANGHDVIGATYNIRHHWSYDGQVFVPEGNDNVSPALDVGSGGAWDDANVKDHKVFKEGSTYYMTYTGWQAGGFHEIGLATASSPQGPWTKDSGNPIITSDGAATDQEWVGTPCLIKDNDEPDANKRYKILYEGTRLTPSVQGKIYLATAPSPFGTWTKQGVAIANGGASSWNERASGRPFAHKVGSVWYIWFQGSSTGSGPQQQVGVATTSDLNSIPYTQDAANPYIPKFQDPKEDLTANLGGTRTLQVGDTSDFVKDAVVIVTDDTTENDYSQSRVRKIVSSTQIDLYHALDGFTTASSAQARMLSGGVVDIGHVVFSEGKWWFFVTPFQTFGDHASFKAHDENSGLMWSVGLLDKPKTWEWLASQPIMKHPYNADGSSENVALVSAPVPAGKRRMVVISP